MPKICVKGSFDLRESSGLLRLQHCNTEECQLQCCNFKEQTCVGRFAHQEILPDANRAHSNSYSQIVPFHSLLNLEESLATI